MEKNDQVKALEAQMADMAKRLMPTEVTTEMVDKALAAYANQSGEWLYDDGMRAALEAVFGIASE